MEFKLKLEGKEKTVVLDDPTGENQYEYIKKAEELSIKEGKNPHILSDFLKFRDELVVKLSSGTIKDIKELNKFPISEKNKLAYWVEEQFQVLKGGDLEKKS